MAIVPLVEDILTTIVGQETIHKDFTQCIEDRKQYQVKSG